MSAKRPCGAAFAWQRTNDSERQFRGVEGRFDQRLQRYAAGPTPRVGGQLQQEATLSAGCRTCAWQYSLDPIGNRLSCSTPPRRVSSTSCSRLRGLQGFRSRVLFHLFGFQFMNHSILLAALLTTVGLAACDRPAVVAVPVPVAVPGPAGPQGSTGATGETGNTGKTGDGTTVIVVAPPASAPAN